MPFEQLHDSILGAAEWTFARSSGAGGQNVNKVNTKAVLTVPVDALVVLSETQRAALRSKLAPRVVGDALVIQVQDTRSQLENRELAVRRLEALIVEALTPVKLRRPTRPTKASQERRLLAKRVASRSKQSRGPTPSSDD